MQLSCAMFLEMRKPTSNGKNKFTTANLQEIHFNSVDRELANQPAQYLTLEVANYTEQYGKITDFLFYYKDIQLLALM
uniref:Uncharacterized protein n=1 Tax=Anguilla anguilla TaxID=7936 RepID=A0A0E9UMR6_ANGAN